MTIGRHTLAACWMALLIAALFGCTVRQITPAELGDPDARSRVLIATLSSDFKNAVVDEVAQELVQDSVYVRVIGLEFVAETSIDDYDAILLVNTCHAWMIDYRVTRLLKHTDRPDRVVVLTTAADPNWEAKNLDVDAVSSASVLEKVPNVAEKVSEVIRTKLNAP